jgi:hypothetical protein
MLLTGATMLTSLEALRTRGWLVEPASERRSLPAAIHSRYPELPQDVAELVTRVESCRSAEGDAWLITAVDFARVSPDGFEWNACEQMALEAADDEAERAAIVAFWDAHFPLLLAVHSDYDYFAVCVGGEAHGAVVHGCAPEWEQSTEVAPTLAAFLAALATAAAGDEPPYPYSLLFR